MPVAGFEVGSGGRQDFDHLRSRRGGAPSGGDVKRRRARFGGGVGIGPGGDEDLHHRRLFRPDRIVQRRLALFVPGVDIGATSHQGSDQLGLPGEEVRGVVQGSIPILVSGAEVEPGHFERPDQKPFAPFVVGRDDTRVLLGPRGHEITPNG